MNQKFKKRSSCLLKKEDSLRSQQSVDTQSLEMNDLLQKNLDKNIPNEWCNRVMRSLKSYKCCHDHLDRFANEQVDEFYKQILKQSILKTLPSQNLIDSSITKQLYILLYGEVQLYEPIEQNDNEDGSDNDVTKIQQSEAQVHHSTITKETTNNLVSQTDNSHLAQTRRLSYSHQVLPKGISQFALQGYIPYKKLTPGCKSQNSFASIILFILQAIFGDVQQVPELPIGILASPKGEVIVAQISKKNIEAILRTNMRELYLKVEVLEKFLPFTSSKTMLALGKELVLKTYNRGGIIYQEGEESNEIYFIKEGEVTFSKILEYEKSLDKNEQKDKQQQQQQSQQSENEILIQKKKKNKTEVIISQINDGQMFGEDEVFLKVKRQKTARVNSAFLEVYSLESHILFEFLNKIEGNKQVIQQLTTNSQNKQQFYQGMIEQSVKSNTISTQGNKHIPVNHKKIYASPHTSSALIEPHTPQQSQQQSSKFFTGTDPSAKKYAESESAKQSSAKQNNSFTITQNKQLNTSHHRHLSSNNFEQDENINKTAKTPKVYLRSSADLNTQQPAFASSSEIYNGTAQSIQSLISLEQLEDAQTKEIGEQINYNKRFMDINMTNKKVGFSNPLFSEMDPTHLSMIRKLNQDYDKLKNPEKYKDNYLQSSNSTAQKFISSFIQLNQKIQNTSCQLIAPQDQQTSQDTNPYGLNHHSLDASPMSNIQSQSQPKPKVKSKFLLSDPSDKQLSEQDTKIKVNIPKLQNSPLYIASFSKYLSSPRTGDDGHINSSPQNYNVNQEGNKSHANCTTRRTLQNNNFNSLNSTPKNIISSNTPKIATQTTTKNDMQITVTTNTTAPVTTKNNDINTPHCNKKYQTNQTLNSEQNESPKGDLISICKGTPNQRGLNLLKDESPANGFGISPNNSQSNTNLSTLQKKRSKKVSVKLNYGVQFGFGEVANTVMKEQHISYDENSQQCKEEESSYNREEQQQCHLNKDISLKSFKKKVNPELNLHFSQDQFSPWQQSQIIWPEQQQQQQQQKKLSQQSEFSNCAHSQSFNPSIVHSPKNQNQKSIQNRFNEIVKVNRDARQIKFKRPSSSISQMNIKFNNSSSSNPLKTQESVIDIYGGRHSNSNYLKYCDLKQSDAKGFHSPQLPIGKLSSPFSLKSNNFFNSGRKYSQASPFAISSTSIGQQQHQFTVCRRGSNSFLKLYENKSDIDTQFIKQNMHQHSFSQQKIIQPQQLSETLLTPQQQQQDLSLIEQPMKQDLLNFSSGQQISLNFNKFSKQNIILPSQSYLQSKQTVQLPQEQKVEVTSKLLNQLYSIFPIYTKTQRKDTVNNKSTDEKCIKNIHTQQLKSNLSSSSLLKISSPTCSMRGQLFKGKCPPNNKQQ